MMQRLQKLPLPLRILAYAAAAAAVLAVAAGVGVMAALMFGQDEGSPPQGANPQRGAGEAEPGQASKQENAAEENASEGSRKTEYLKEVADIQNGSVEASLESNEQLLRYDKLTADDIGEMEANYDALGDYNDRVEDLDPPEEYEGQYKLFVLAIDELHAANERAYRLVANPTSATQAGFEAYDQHVDRATANLQRSNEILGRDYKTTETAHDTSLG
jgi:hypothetical protein